MPPTVPRRISAAAGFLWRWASYLAASIALATVIAAGIRNRHSWHWGDFPTWVLAVGAIITSIFAFLAFRKQSEEVRTLKDQLRDQHRTVGLTMAFTPPARPGTTPRGAAPGPGKPR